MGRYSVDIECPGCHKVAKFEEPFAFTSSHEVVPAETRTRHRWGGWIVEERFPSQFRWKAPCASGQYLRGGGDRVTGGYPLLTHGLVQCSFCHVNEKHRLNWPQDAYWRWDIRGELLWAWDRDHAEEILAFVKGSLRPSRRSYTLRYIPSHFLSAKVRDLVVQKLEKSLHSQ